MEVTWLAHLSRRGAGAKANFELFVRSRPTNWWVVFLESEANAFVGKGPDGQILTNPKTGASWSFLEDAKKAVLREYERSLCSDTEQQCVNGKCDFDLKSIEHDDTETHHMVIRECTVCHFVSEEDWTYCDCGKPEFEPEDRL